MKFHKARKKAPKPTICRMFTGDHVPFLLRDVGYIHNFKEYFERLLPDTLRAINEFGGDKQALLNYLHAMTTIIRYSTFSKR